MIQNYLKLYFTLNISDAWSYRLILKSNVLCMTWSNQTEEKKHIHLKIKSAFIANLFDICNSIAINRGISIFGGRFDALIWRTTSWTWHFFSIMSNCWINMENIKYYPFGTKWFNVHLLGDRDIGKVILVMHSIAQFIFYLKNNT